MKGPDGKTRKVDVRPGTEDGLYDVVFVPEDSGAYKVNLFIDGVSSNVEVTVNAMQIEELSKSLYKLDQFLLQVL